MKATKLFLSFFESEKTGGFLLIFCTIISILVSNSDLKEAYFHFWEIKLGYFNTEQIVNDGLMTIFFLMIGLELEREIYIGELSNIKNASLPIVAAIGGMLIPAAFYYLTTVKTKYTNGIGIPMATDIAFALGILSLLGNRVPVALKIFLTALAVIDDLGAILVIAFFYTKKISWLYLLLSLGIFGVLLILNRLKIYKLLPYLILGVFMWFFMLNSGVHPTITGVLLAFAIPFQKGEKKSISYQLEKWLHVPVAFFILPLFALANTAILLNFSNKSIFYEPYSIGILAGLVLGKPIGIFTFSFIAYKLNLIQLPKGLSLKSIFGAGLLGGIGFTMSIFITILAFNDSTIISNSKFSIIISSLIAGIIGYTFLFLSLKNRKC